MGFFVFANSRQHLFLWRGIMETPFRPVVYPLLFDVWRVWPDRGFFLNQKQAKGRKLIASAMAPGDGDDRVDRGHQYLEDGDFEAAKGQFDEALTNDFSNIGARLGLCHALAGLGELKDAEKTFEAAASLEPGPGFVRAFNRLGISLRQMEAYDLFLEAFSRAIEINSGDPVIFYNMSLVHIVRLQLDKAAELFEKAIELKPDFVEAKLALEKVPAWKDSLGENRE